MNILIKNIKKTHISKQKILHFMNALDGDFIPPLSTQIDNYENYINKLLNYAEIYLAIKNNQISAMVAMYCNDRDGLTSYISYIGVNKKNRGQGLGLLLINKCIEHSKSEGMERIRLETSIHNNQALKLYNKAGFHEGRKILSKDRVILEKNVKNYH